MNEIIINAKYAPLFKLKTRYCIVTGGRGSGKSFGIAGSIALDCRTEGRGWLYTRQTMTSAKTSVIPEFLAQIENLNIAHEFRVEKSDDRVTHIQSGSFILFSGLKTSSGFQTAKLKSLKGINAWFMDEAIELQDEDEFEKINLSIRDTRRENRVILSLNPEKVGHWIHERFFAKSAPGGIELPHEFNGVIRDVTYIHTTYLDNALNLNESFIKAACSMRIQYPERYNTLFLGHWSKGGGLGFNADDFQKYNLDFSKRQDYNVYLFVDPASGRNKKTDFTSMFVIGLGRDQKYYVLDGCRGRFNLTERTARVFELVRKWNPLQVYYEQYGMQSDAEHIRDKQEQQNYRFSIQTVGGNISKLDRIASLEPYFSEKKIYFPHQLGYYDEDRVYHDLTQEFYSEEFVKFPGNVDKSGLHDDMLDCLARIASPDVKMSFPAQDDSFTAGRYASVNRKPYNPLD